MKSILLNYSLVLVLSLVLLLRLPYVDFSSEVENSLPLEIPLIETLRSKLVHNAKQMLPSPQAGLLLGMTIGVKDEIPYSYNQILKKVGVVHVVVVSGQNLTLLAGFILNFAQFLGRKKTIIFSMAIVSFYIFLTGFQIPVIRAALMFGLCSLAKLFGREGDDLRVLLITALLMLIINPLWITSVSFQLSFAATVGVVIIAPILIKSSPWVPEVLREGILVTFAAQVMTSPIIGYHFNQFSIAGFFSNALILWTIPIIMIGGALVLLLSLVSFSISSMIIWFPGILLNYFVTVVDLFNRPNASTYVDPISGVQIFGIYAFLASICIILQKKSMT